MVFFDIEGTLVSNNTWKTMRSHPDVVQGRIRRAYAEVLPAWLLTKAKLLDDTQFRHYWVMAMAKLFGGWSQEQVIALFAWVASHVEYHQDVVEKLQQHKANGDAVVLVSGIFEDGALQFARYLGADDGIGTKLAYQTGICTGKITGQSCAGSRKLDFIQGYMRSKNSAPDLAGSYAYADSYSDAPMLSAVGNPVATYPEERLRELALTRGWTIFPAN
ncbi:MAG: HAD-IB family hydrolase [Anaerolineae bacterium]